MGKIKGVLLSKLAIKIYFMALMWSFVLIALMGGVSQEVIFMFTNSVEALGLTEGAEVAGYSADDIEAVVTANQTEWCLTYLEGGLNESNVSIPSSD